MNFRELLKQSMVMSLATVVCLNCVMAQEPVSQLDPIEVDDHQTQDEFNAWAAANPGTGAAFIQPKHRSEMLKATFNPEWLKISTPTQSFVFWGARIIDLDPNSPLRSLRLLPGDVITRLDGIPIGTGMKLPVPGEDPVVPQLDKHFGQTKVRFIFRSTKQVQEQSVDLGPMKPKKTPGNPTGGPTPPPGTPALDP